jgi:hypothetical protein
MLHAGNSTLRVAPSTKSSLMLVSFPLQETEKRQEEERIRMENILSGNPLLNYASQVQKGDLKVSG